MEAHREPCGETLVGLRVGGEHGDLLAADEIENGLGDRSVRERRAAPGTRDAELDLAFGGEEQDVGAFCRKLFEHRRHDLVEDRLEFLDLEERPRDLGERLEHALARGRGRRLGQRPRLTWLDAEVLPELLDRAEERRGADGEAARGLTPVERQGEVAHLDLVAFGEDHIGDVAVVDLDPVGGAKIHHAPRVAPPFQPGVVAGDREVLQDQLVVGGPADPAGRDHQLQAARNVSLCPPQLWHGCILPRWRRQCSL